MNAGSWLYESLENHDGSLGMLRRAMIVKVDDSGPQQLVNLQGLASDMPQNVVRILPHGFSSNPPLQSEGILKSLAGRSDRGMFIGGEHYQYRQRNLPSGNAVLYDDKGNVVWMQGANGVAITTKQGALTLMVANGMPVTVQNGDLTVTMKNGNVYVDPGKDNVFLGGGPAANFALVQTVSGPSSNVLAAI